MHKIPAPASQKIPFPVKAQNKHFQMEIIEISRMKTLIDY